MPNLLRRTLPLLTGLLVAGSALVASAGFQPLAGSDLRPAFASSCIGYCKHPTNAAKVFRWGLEDWRQEFESGRLRHWQSNHPGLVGQQHGMLTIGAGAHTGSVRVWPSNQSATYGRWEARVRAVELSKGARRYRFTWELVPVGGPGCGGIVLSSYKPGAGRASGAVRTSRHRQFTFSKKRDLRSRAWHTYAVEVTKKHISWFVDTKVIHTERRPEALTGVKLRPQFRIKGSKHKRMNHSNMQMDWVRYYTLKRPNARSIKAPPMRASSYHRPC